MKRAGLEKTTGKRRAGPVAVNVRNVPPDVRRGFKSRCADAGVTMESALLGFMAAVAAGSLPAVSR